MKVEVDRSVNRLTLGPVPDAIVAEMKRAFEEGVNTSGGLNVRLEVRNSMAMSTAVYFDEENREARIVLDWAQMERIALVARQLRWGEDITGQQDRFAAAVARELRVYWKRRLVTLGTGEITDEDRRYDGRREDDLGNAEPFTASENALAVRYGLFLMSHEICHIVAREEADMVQEVYSRFEERYPRLINPSPSLAEELFCDQQALAILTDMKIHATPIELNNEFALAMAVERLQSEVRAAAPRIRAGWATWGRPKAGKRRLDKETRLVAEWFYRMFQADVMLDEILVEAGYDDATRAAAKATRSALYRWPDEALAEDYMGWLN